MLHFTHSLVQLTHTRNGTHICVNVKAALLQEVLALKVNNMRQLRPYTLHCSCPSNTLIVLNTKTNKNADKIKHVEPDSKLPAANDLFQTADRYVIADLFQ